jgi:hypothetical protein
MTSTVSSEVRNATMLMIEISGTLARHLPAYCVRGFEADLRALAGARERAGDSSACALLASLAASVVANRPELFGH